MVMTVRVCKLSPVGALHVPVVAEAVRELLQLEVGYVFSWGSRTWTIGCMAVPGCRLLGS